MPVHTAVVAALLLLLVAGLGLAITVRRRRDRIGPGMTGDASFTRLQRAHGNAVEHVSLLVVALLILELLAPNSRVVVGASIATVFARVAHASGIVLRTGHPLHALGAALTYALEIVLAYAILVVVARR